MMRLSLRTRIAWLFISLVALLLGVFGSYVYVKSSRLRYSEFVERLRERADIAGQITIEADDLPVTVRARLQARFLDALPSEALEVYESKDSLLFRRNDALMNLPHSRIAAAHRGQEQVWADGRRQYLLERVPSRKGDYYVAVAAEDSSGLEQLDSLLATLIWGGIVAVAFAGGLAWLIAGWSVEPIKELTEEAKAIESSAQRLTTPTTGDELAELATAFNKLLVRLQEASDLQRSFIANASHELRTPLTIVSGELEQLENLVTSTEKQELVASARHSIGHLADLIQQLLWLAQSSQAYENVARHVLRLEELVFKALQRARRQFPERQLVLDIDALADAEQEPLVLGNALLLEAACYNLIANAAKYALPGTPVRVVVAFREEQLLVQVIDQGPGLPPDELARLKEPFYRGTSAEGKEGSGIGLTLVDRIAILHNGTLDLAVNGGLTATLSLPVVEG